MNNNLKKYTRLYLMCLILLSLPRLFSKLISNLGYIQLLNNKNSIYTINPILENVWELALEFSDNTAAKRGLLVYAVSRNDCEQFSSNDLINYSHKPYITSWIKESLRSGEGKRAYCWIKAFLSVAPEDGDAWYYYGMYLRSINEGNQAVYAFGEALSKDNLSIQKGIILYQLGVVNVGILKNYPEAERYFRKAVDQWDAKNDWILGDSYCQLAYVLYEQNVSSDEIIANFNQGLSLTPDNYWCWLHYANAIYRESKSLDNAKEKIDIAISIWPNTDSRQWPFRFLAAMYLNEERNEEACQMFLIAMDND